MTMERRSGLNETRKNVELEKLIGLRGTENDKAVTMGKLREIFPALYKISPQQESNRRNLGDLIGWRTTTTNAIDALETDMTAAQGAISTLQGQMATIQGQMATIQGQMATIQGQMATVQGQMATVQGQIATLGLRQVSAAQVASPGAVGATYSDMATLALTPGAAGNALLILCRYQLTYAPPDAQTFDVRITLNDTQIVMDAYEGDHSARQLSLGFLTTTVAGTNTVALEALSPHAGATLANVSITAMEFNP